MSLSKFDINSIFNTDLTVISGGVTSVLQPLDVSLNHPFKCRVRDQWTRWMSSGAAELTAAGNFKRPLLSTIATWATTAWESLEDCIIQKSFKKCSISNNLDGTEDDILWTVFATTIMTQIKKMKMMPTTIYL